MGRIKGILDKGTEVELELLSVKESVELLSAVAQLDTTEVSPCLIGIVSERNCFWYVIDGALFFRLSFADDCLFV